MELLKELSSFLSKRKMKSLELVGYGQDKESRVDQFYEAILNRQFETDEEAAAFFYQASPTHPSYKNLKHSLLKRLVNAVFFINLPSPAYNDYERDYFYCCKFMAAAKILLRLQAGKAGITLCQKVLNKAEKNEYTEFVLDASKYLRGYYGTRAGSWKDFLYYNEMFKKAEKVWMAENLAHEYYIRLMVPYAREKASIRKTHSDATKYFRQIEPHLREHSSPYLHFLAYYIEVIKCLSVNDYEQTIKVCGKAIAFFEAKPYVYKTPLSTFYHNMMACYTQLRRYDDCIRLMEKSATLIQPGTYNWFRGQELFFILALHTGNYQEAYKTFSGATDHARFRFLSQPLQETWRIYESYLHFLVEMGQVVPEESDRRFNNFRLGKFLNSVPIFSRDKRGMNIPILVIQILFLIIRKDYHTVIDRMEAIEKYCIRHKLRSTPVRSNYFIKMLLEIPKSDFHRSSVERKTGQYLTKLRATPLTIVNQIYEIEIIPYEVLWDFILQSLERKHYRNGRARG